MLEIAANAIAILTAVATVAFFAARTWQRRSESRTKSQLGRRQFRSTQKQSRSSQGPQHSMPADTGDVGALSVNDLSWFNRLRRELITPFVAEYYAPAASSEMKRVEIRRVLALDPESGVMLQAFVGTEISVIQASRIRPADVHDPNADLLREYQLWRSAHD